MNISSAFKRLRAQAGLTQQEVADKVGVTKVSVGQWENGKATPRPTKLQALADLFGVPVSELLGEGGTPAGARQIVGESESVPYAFMGRVHAGFTKEAIPDPDATVQVPRDVARAHPNGFMLMVEGNCMDRAYPEGCLVLCDPDIQPRNGQAVVADVGQGEVVLRRYMRGQRSLMLSPDSHEDYEDMIFTDGEFESVRLVGTITWFQAAMDETLGTGPF